MPQPAFHPLLQLVETDGRARHQRSFFHKYASLGEGHGIQECRQLSAAATHSLSEGIRGDLGVQSCHFAWYLEARAWHQESNGPCQDEHEIKISTMWIFSLNSVTDGLMSPSNHLQAFVRIYQMADESNCYWSSWSEIQGQNVSLFTDTAERRGSKGPASREEITHLFASCISPEVWSSRQSMNSMQSSSKGCDSTSIMIP